MKEPIPFIIPIRAAVLRQPGAPLKIERLEMESPREDEMLVRIVASGICHTDIDFCEGGVSGPVVLGHEGSGVVEQVGRKVKGFRPGDHVVLSYQSRWQGGLAERSKGTGQAPGRSRSPERHSGGRCASEVHSQTHQAIPRWAFPFRPPGEVLRLCQDQPRHQRFQAWADRQTRTID